ncbi:MAG: DnaA/Hda family protein [Pseudomonadota bacterium]
MARQLTFDLPTRAALGREDFFVSPANALALATVDDWAQWPMGKLVLVGPHGAGKTHLAHVWAQAAGARIVAAAELGGTDLPALASGGAVAVEDADAGPFAEDALFHLHNLLQQAGGALLITATRPPKQWSLTLPDLASRMQAAMTATLDPPDDALLQAVLVKLFDDRQLAVGAEVTEYLAKRMERSFEAAQQIVSALDDAGLAEGRAITRRLAGEVLDKLGGADA